MPAQGPGMGEHQLLPCGDSGVLAASLQKEVLALSRGSHSELIPRLLGALYS